MLGWAWACVEGRKQNLRSPLPKGTGNLTALPHPTPKQPAVILEEWKIPEVEDKRALLYVLVLKFSCDAWELTGFQRSFLTHSLSR
jgi:hypothetical protein